MISELIADARYVADNEPDEHWVLVLLLAEALERAEKVADTVRNMGEPEHHNDIRPTHCDSCGFRWPCDMYLLHEALREYEQ